MRLLTLEDDPLLGDALAAGLRRLGQALDRFRDGVEQRIAGLDAGADDDLIKPISIDELAARLRAMLRRSAGRRRSGFMAACATTRPPSRCTGGASRWN